MPFTPSHVAAVLPLHRWRLPASALAIGSMSPDAPYYLPIPVTGEHSHSLPGLLGIDLLVGLAALLAWQGFVGRSVVAFAPAVIADRLRDYPVGIRRTMREPWRVVAALLLGACTHVAWDSFTHRAGWATRHVSWLASDLGPIGAYRWAQYVSSVLGAVIVAVWCRRWWRSRAADAPIHNGPSLAVRLSAAGAVLLAAAAGAVVGLVANDDAGVGAAGFSAFTGASGCAIGALLVVCALWTALQPR